MSSHPKVSKLSGREVIALSGQRVTVGKTATNHVSLRHDVRASVTRLRRRHQLRSPLRDA